MKTSDKTILEKIYKEILELNKNIKDHDLNSFLDNGVIERAVSMSLIIIGENIKHLSSELTESNNHVRWKDFAGLRDVAAHGYSTLRMDDIYTDATENIPKLQKQIEAILKKEEDIGDK